MQTKITKWGALTTPVYVFTIHDILDLITASLQCIFDLTYFIKKCGHCDNLYVTNDRKRSYCPKQDFNDINPDCRKLEKLKQQSIYEKKESIRIHRSISQIYRNKYGGYDPIYTSYMADSQEWRNRIKDGLSTDEEYIKWLKSKYARNGRG